VGVSPVIVLLVLTVLVGLAYLIVRSKGKNPAR
jgi:hypothetical protein